MVRRKDRTNGRRRGKSTAQSPAVTGRPAEADGAEDAAIWFTVADAAQLLDVSPSRVFDGIRDGAMRVRFRTASDGAAERPLVSSDALLERAQQAGREGERLTAEAAPVPPKEVHRVAAALAETEAATEASVAPVRNGENPPSGGADGEPGLRESEEADGAEAASSDEVERREASSEALKGKDLSGAEVEEASPLAAVPRPPTVEDVAPEAAPRPGTPEVATKPAEAEAGEDAVETDAKQKGSDASRGTPDGKASSAEQAVGSAKLVDKGGPRSSAEEAPPSRQKTRRTLKDAVVEAAADELPEPEPVLTPAVDALMNKLDATQEQLRRQQVAREVAEAARQQAKEVADGARQEARRVAAEAEAELRRLKETLSEGERARLSLASSAQDSKKRADETERQLRASQRQLEQAGDQIEESLKAVYERDVKVARLEAQLEASSKVREAGDQYVDQLQVRLTRVEDRAEEKEREIRRLALGLGEARGEIRHLRPPVVLEGPVSPLRRVMPWASLGAIGVVALWITWALARSDRGLEAGFVAVVAVAAAFLYGLRFEGTRSR